MADADEAAGPQPAANDPPSSELVNQHDMADAEDQVALIQHEMEFASAERLAFFSDAVVAIALTLLALGLPVPGGIESPDSASVSDMIRDAARHVDDYLAFLISFLVIGAHWRLHHRVFRYVRHATRAIIRLNLYWLLLIVITPFTTKTLSIGQQNLLRFGLYAVTQTLQFAIFAVIVVLIIRTQHLPAAADLQRLHSALWQPVAIAIGPLADGGDRNRLRGIDPALSPHRTARVRCLGVGAAGDQSHSSATATPPACTSDLDHVHGLSGRFRHAQEKITIRRSI